MPVQSVRLVLLDALEIRGNGWEQLAPPLLNGCWIVAPQALERFRKRGLSEKQLCS